MFFKKKIVKKRFYQKKSFIVIGVLLLIAVLFRAAIPDMTRALVNKRLEKESPNFSFHINDIDLHILQGKYVVKGITGTIKNEKAPFLTIQSVVTKIPWKDFFNDRPVADIMMNKMHLTASDLLLKKAKAEGERIKQIIAEKKKEGPQDQKKDPPININSFRLTDSRVTIKEFMSFKGKEIRNVTDINALVTNLTPTDKKTETTFQVFANVFGPAPMFLVGKAELNNRPLSWDVNTEMKNFDLRTINPFIKERVRAYIHKGKMNVYAEAEALSGKIKGYVKPFVMKMKMDTPPGGFNFTGAAAATGGNLVKLLLTDSEARTLATHVPFTFEKKISFEVLPALQEAVVHRAKQNIQEGIEDKIGDKGLGLEAEVEMEEKLKTEKKKD